ncbi:hypothetical protein PF006_g33552, partial [Phytophthora fragariae]
WRTTRSTSSARVAAPRTASTAAQSAVNGDGPDSPSATRLSNALVAAKDEFERVHVRVMREVQRFRGQKAVKLKKLFLEFAQLQLRNSKELEKIVAQSATELETPLPAKLLYAAQTPASMFESRDSFGLDKKTRSASPSSRRRPSPHWQQQRRPPIQDGGARRRPDLLGRSETTL